MRRMLVDGSRVRERVSTAMTCVDWSFQGQYFLQLAVETSSQEYWNSCCVLKRRMIVVRCVMVDGMCGRDINDAKCRPRHF